MQPSELRELIEEGRRASSVVDNYEGKNDLIRRLTDALTAFLSEGQDGAEPVAWLAEGYGYKRVCIEKEAAEKLARGGSLTPLYAHPPHRGDWERACEAATLRAITALPDEAVGVMNRKGQNALATAVSEILRSAAPYMVPEVGSLTIHRLQTAHVERQEEWCPDQKPDLSFRGNEMAGEVGEACNVIKKLERERHGWRGSRATKEQLADELADVIHTAVLCAITAGLDLEPAVVAKFNATSEKNGLATLLAASSNQGGDHAE